MLLGSTGLKPLDPVVDFISPAHDEIVPAGPFQITIHFSEDMDPSSLMAGTLLDDNTVDPSTLSYDAKNRLLTCT